MKRPNYVTSAMFAVASIWGIDAVSHPAAAIDVAIAKQCNAMLAKAFPPREPGNPAAGSAKGSGRDQRVYFKRCVENNGKMDDAPIAATGKN
jgi:hypothetical protein